MVINSNNNFLHARIHPEMLLIGVSISNGKVQLSTPDVESVTFPIPDQSAPVQAVRFVLLLVDILAEGTLHNFSNKLF